MSSSMRVNPQYRRQYFTTVLVCDRLAVVLCDHILPANGVIKAVPASSEVAAQER